MAEVLYKARALRRLPDEDWKTQAARGYPDVPEGAEVGVVEEGYRNFYGGPWTRVEWGGELYWVDPGGLERVAGTTGGNGVCRG